MGVKQAPTDLKVMENLLALNKKIFYHSRFKFLRETKGIRKPSLTGFEGTTGSGKSSLLKTIICDTLNDADVFLILTEESIEQYIADLRIINPQCKIERLKYYHANKTPENIKSDSRELFTWYTELILQSGCEFIVWDNPSTSEFYSSRFAMSVQDFFWENIYNFVHNNNMSLVYTIHTKKEVNDSIGRMIEGEDVRGTNQSFQRADYFYILQRFQEGNKFYPFVRIRKHRFHKFIDNFFFFLSYQEGHFKTDRVVDFNEVNDAFTKRNVLGKKK